MTTILGGRKHLHPERRHILAGNLKAFLEASGLCKKELAAKAGISTKRLYRYANGVGEPPFAVLYSLCQLLGCPVERMVLNSTEYEEYLVHNDITKFKKVFYNVLADL